MDGGEKLKYTYEYNGEELTLRDSVELLALSIGEDFRNGMRARDITRKCKILDSLTNALSAVNS